MTTVSAIVAAYNSRAFLPQALASILAQTRPPDEIILVDDGSTDGTAELAAEFGAAVRYFRTDQIGPPATRNFGVAAARGDYVSFLDADDLWAPGKQERQLAALAGGAGRCCLCHVRMAWGDPDSPDAAYFKTHPRGQVVPGYATIALMAERSLFAAVGAFDPALWHADSVEWLGRAEALGHAPIILEEPLVTHRVHGSNLTQRRRQAGIDEFAGVLRRRIAARRAAGR